MDFTPCKAPWGNPVRRCGKKKLFPGQECAILFANSFPCPGFRGGEGLSCEKGDAHRDRFSHCIAVRGGAVSHPVGGPLPPVGHCGLLWGCLPALLGGGVDCRPAGRALLGGGRRGPGALWGLSVPLPEQPPAKVLPGAADLGLPLLPGGLPAACAGGYALPGGGGFRGGVLVGGPAGPGGLGGAVLLPALPPL